MAAKQTFQLIRIAALLAIIFAAGIVIGRYTSPAPVPAPAPEPVLVAGAPRASRVDYAVRTMSRDFEFDAEKEKEFRVLMERMEQAMRPLEQGSVERRDLWRQFLPEIRAFVPDHLMDKFEAQNQRTERRFERIIRQRERTGGRQ
jgi:hypothetical protein